MQAPSPEHRENPFVWSIGTLALEVRQGDLLEAPERAWVNSEQTDFVMAPGGRSISAQLRARCPEADNELAAQTQGEILRPGTVLATTGPSGRTIYHAGFHAPDEWLWGNEDKEAVHLEAIRECVEKAVMMAIEGRLPDIAFPLIGTGVFALPIRPFAGMFFDVVARIAMREESPLRIVLYVRNEEDVKDVVGYGTQALAALIDGGPPMLQPAGGHSLIRHLRAKVRAHADERLVEGELLRFAETALATDLAVLADHFRITIDDLFHSIIGKRRGLKFTFGLTQDRLAYVGANYSTEAPPWLSERFTSITSRPVRKAIEHLIHDRNDFAHGRAPRGVSEIVKDIEEVWGPEALPDPWTGPPGRFWIREFDEGHGLLAGVDLAQDELTWLLPNTRSHVSQPLATVH